MELRDPQQEGNDAPELGTGPLLLKAMNMPIFKRGGIPEYCIADIAAPEANSDNRPLHTSIPMTCIRRPGSGGSCAQGLTWFVTAFSEENLPGIWRQSSDALRVRDGH